MPYLEIDDIKLPQSISIARYLAREANIQGKTNLEQAQADAVVDTCIDALSTYLNKVFFVQDPAAKVLFIIFECFFKYFKFIIKGRGS